MNGTLGSSVYDWTKALALTSKTNTGIITTTVTAMWRDKTLVITLVSHDGGSTQLSTVAHLQIHGDQLVISGTRPSPTGETSAFEVVYRRDQ